ncbi:hypothetical protein VPNG_03435 [Cytospora leucostoma]|uniref:Uncharacterized protein n=1 Tax=Cytospora leucostoma TaxID=1230097 RepID=A0A423XFC5_9PEZI|nr:hypothetical protein VPNG_03435 [Cytospora leucostoma]
MQCPVSSAALTILIPTRVFRLVELGLSPELAKWNAERQSQGGVLPRKGKGLSPTTDRVTELVFGAAWVNLLIGAYDPEALYSNYCLDMGFYYEQGYDVVFPEFEPAFLAASNDPHARESHAGSGLSEVG